MEGPRSLLPLFPALQDDASPQLARCFQSRDGQAALYVEAISSRHNIQKEVAAFSYNLQPLPKGKSYYDCEEGMYVNYQASELICRAVLVQEIENGS